MYEGITHAEQNLLFLESLIPSGEQLYIWCYDASGKYIASSCPEQMRSVFDRAFRILGGLQKAMNLSDETEENQPRLIGTSIGMQWAVTFEAERKRDLIFVIGPVFYAAPRENDLRSALLAEPSVFGNAAWIQEMCGSVPLFPVMNYSVFARYVLMVHNTLTGSQLGLDALKGRGTEQALRQDGAVGERNRIRVYQAEQALLQMVRAGDINYQGAFRNSMSLSFGVPVQGRDPLRQMKTSIIVFTTLVCRAAMEGGLSPETAYALGDSYIQTAEDSRDSGELTALAHAMYHDFIYRVHHMRSNPNYSHAVQKCCDYIELSLDRRIRISDLAALVGYTDYYLTEKFKKETGKSISSYIRDAKIARAKVILQSTDLSVAEISDRLAFNTPNYFIHCFRSVEGCTPAQYRKREGAG
ncbi:MAG: AraC family transcriptional regulator [Lachnospiraceae bacterium]|nr:AraC family transcriptional regulator [Lachnospiraceae bacterium]